MNSKAAKVMARRRGAGAGFWVPYAKELEAQDFGGRAPKARGFALPVCSRWLHRCCGRLRPYCTPSWRHSRVQQRLGRAAPRYYIIRGPGKVHGGAGGGGSGGRNEGAPVGDSPPFVPVSQSWLHRRCAHRGARGRERRRLLFRPGALFTPEGTAKYISLHFSYRRPGVQPPPVRLSSTLAPAK